MPKVPESSSGHSVLEALRLSVLEALRLIAARQLVEWELQGHRLVEQQGIRRIVPGRYTRWGF